MDGRDEMKSTLIHVLGDNLLYYLRRLCELLHEFAVLSVGLRLFRMKQHSRWAGDS